MAELELTFSAPSVTANQSARTITGQIVPFGEIGHTSIGPVMFDAAAFSNIDPASVKLLLQHDTTRPIGKMADFTATPKGINATFKIASTTAGTDSLLEASDGLREGLSVGAQIIDSVQKKDFLLVLQASLKEVSLVTDPAFDSARVAQVAASADTDETPQQSEEIEVSETPDVTPEVTEEVDVVAPVEAARVVASAPMFTAPRSPINSAASYLEHSVKAAQGDDQSRQWVRAADDSTSTNTGLTLPQHMNEFVTSTFGGRPAVDAVTRESLPTSGMSFTIPKIGTAPTVAETAETAAPSETGMTSTYLTVDVKKYSGYNEVSFELLDRSSPVFYNELVRELGRAYAKATDNAVIAALTSSGTASTAITTANAAGLQSFIATESAAAFKGTSEYAQNLVASTDWWSGIMGFADSSGRALYTANNPLNNSGAVSGQSIVGQVLGTNLYVDPNITVSGLIDESAFLIVPGAVSFYETPQTRLQVNLLSTGQVGINIYGYAAIAVKKPTGVRRFNIA